jgi:serine/threonine-protein kinase
VDQLKSLGRYQIQGVLGKGAMGLVYDGRDPKLNRRVAIKTILTRTLDESTARHYSMRFQREVRAVAAISSEAEMEFWNGVKDSDDPEEVVLYIEQFPRGAYVELAQRRLAELRGKKG